jgi:phosphate transport system permease protein
VSITAPPTLDAPVHSRDGGHKQVARRLRFVPDRGDKAFTILMRMGAVAVVAVIGLVGLFLAIRAYPAIAVAKFHFLTTEQWEPYTHHFGIAGVGIDTFLIAAVAVVISVPISLGLSLFISEVAPQRVSRVLVTIVDLMAAVPSVVYAIWGFEFFESRGIGTARFLSTWLSWIPFFRVTGPGTNGVSGNTIYSASTFIVGVVVSLMVIPIQCSVMREGFTLAPLGEREGAFALGATRWGVIRNVVLPFARGEVIGGTMLGLGRALGETLAVYLIISPVFQINWHVLQTGGNSISALIALRSPDASSFETSGLMAAGLALFLVTLLVNFGASAIVNRSRSGAKNAA